MRASRAIGAIVLLAASLATSVARADPQAEYEKARNAYVARAFDDAETRLRALLDPNAQEKLDPALVSQARMYLGATYYLQRRHEEAGTVFERILIDDPRYEPDPLTFPTDVLNAFIDSRAKIREKLQAQAAERARLEAEKRVREEQEKRRREERLHVLEKMASEEKVTVQHTRLVASMPFGAGQFQNGQPALGWALLGIESALVIGTAITVIPYTNAVNRAREEYQAKDPDHKSNQYSDRAASWQVVNLSLCGALAAVMAGGILQAHLAFVPESPEMHTRPIPQARPKIDLAPVISATPKVESTPASGFLGLRGTF